MKAIWSWLGLAGVSILTALPPVPPTGFSPRAIPIPTPPPLIPTPTPTPNLAAAKWYRAAWSAHQYAWPLASQDQLLIANPDGQIAFASGWDQGLATENLERWLQIGQLLCHWPENHRFHTQVYGLGSLERGTFNGDIWIVGGGDPYFTWQDGITLAQNLQDLGIRRISGSLVITGDFTMHGETDPNQAGNLLQKSFTPHLWEPSLQQGSPDVRVNAVHKGTTVPAAAPLLLTHRSRPIAELIPFALRDPAFLLPDLPNLPATLTLEQVQNLLLSPQMRLIFNKAAQPHPAMPLSLSVIQHNHLWIGQFPDGRMILWRTSAPIERITRFLQDIQHPGL